MLDLSGQVPNILLLFPLPPKLQKICLHLLAPFRCSTFRRYSTSKKKCLRFCREISVLLQAALCGRRWLLPPTVIYCNNSTESGSLSILIDPHLLTQLHNYLRTSGLSVISNQSGYRTKYLYESQLLTTKPMKLYIPNWRLCG